jgi:hypothetical protein
VLIRRAGPGDVAALRAIAAAVYEKTGRHEQDGFRRVFFRKPVP